MTELWKAPVIDWRDYNHKKVEIIVIDTREMWQVFLRTEEGMNICIEAGPPKGKR